LSHTKVGHGLGCCEAAGEANAHLHDTGTAGGKKDLCGETFLVTVFRFGCGRGTISINYRD
jgi:hypothetical protein